MIGIDDYVDFDDREGGDLRGAEADALRMRSAFQSVLGVPPQNTLTLLGRAATRDSIEFAFTTWLPERVKDGDRVLVFYSGHGSQVFDQDGDEADGLDEAICPVDARRISSERDIRDDELREWLQGLPVQEKIFILDSCHSGTATRAGLGYVRSRGLVRDSVRDRAVQGPTPPDGMDLDAVPGLIEIAASSSGQVALEVELPESAGVAAMYGGVFTTRLLRKIQSLPRDASFEDLYWATYHAVKAEGFAQDPQLSGPAGRALLRAFGQSQPETLSASPVVAARYLALDAGNGRIRMSNGTVAPFPGLVVTGPSGSAEVTSLGPAESAGTLLRGRILPGDSLVPVGTRLDDPALIIDLEDDAPRGPALTAVSRLPGVRLRRASGLGADFSLVGSAGRDSILFLGRDRAVRLSVPRLPGVADLERLTTFLASERNARLMRLLENPGSPFGMTLRPGAATPAFRVGETIQLRLASDREGYLTLVDQSPGGALTVLFPNRASGPVFVPSGQEALFPPAGTGLTLTASPPLGRGTVLAVLTPVPVSFDFGPSGFAALTDSEVLVRAVASTIAVDARLLPATTAGLGYVRLDNWNSALMTYEILPP